MPGRVDDDLADRVLGLLGQRLTDERPLVLLTEREGHQDEQQPDRDRGRAVPEALAR